MVRVEYMTKRPEILSTGYMKNFSCIGPECEDSCCTGWQIGLSAGDLQRLGNYLTSKNRAEELEEVVVFDQPPGKTGDTARFNFGWDSACPMLENDLCVMHRDRGASILPTLCATFPRNFLEIGDQIQLHGQFSCPEVVRLCLADGDGQSLAGIDAERIPPRYEVTKVSKANAYHGGLLMALEYIGHVFSREDIDLYQKNMSLVSFCKRIGSFCHSDAARDPAPKLKKLIAKLMDNPPKYGKPGSVMPDALVELVIGILGLRAQYCNNARFRATCAAIYKGYGQLGEVLAGGNLLNPELRARLWQVFLARRDKICAMAGAYIEARLDRYCFALWRQILFHGNNSPAASAQKLVFSLAVIRFMLFSHPLMEQRFLQNKPQQDKEPLIDQAMIAAIQVFTKYIGSDDKLLQQITVAMNDAGLDTAANLAMFLEV